MRRLLGVALAVSALWGFGTSSALAAAGRTATSYEVSNTGEAQYTVPLSLPVGVRGLKPDLAFTYSHRSGGSGWLGAGWELSGLSAIARCPKTWATNGASVNVKLDATDRFCLDGQQLMLETAGATYGANGTVYRTEMESYSRITSYGTAGTGPAYFYVETKDGRILEFGSRTDSRIEALGSATVRAWALTTIRDRSNNRIEFYYTEDAVLGSFRIDNIQWSWNSAQGTSVPYKVQFTYETQPASESQNGYLAGSLIKDVTRMTRADVTYVPWGSLLRRYSIAYEGSLSSASHSRVASITECAGSAGTDCLPATTFSYQNGTNAYNTPVATGIVVTPLSRNHVMDVNGDGKSDFVYSASGIWKVALGDAGGSYASIVTTAISSSFSTYSTGIDYNADNLSDLLTTNGTNWVVATGTSAGGFNTTVDTGISATGASDVRAMDVDGDGLEDVVYTVQANKSVRYRLRIWGGTFGAELTLVSDPSARSVRFEDGTKGRVHGGLPDFNGDGHTDIGFTWKYRVFMSGEWQIYTTTDALMSGPTPQVVYLGDFDFAAQVAGDFNADGLTDFAESNATNWCYRFSIGTGMTPCITGPSSVGHAPDKAITADWDGDGFADILTPDSAQNFVIVRSNGEALQPAFATGASAASVDFLYTADVNGDGLVDAVWTDATSGVLKVMLHSGAQPDLLTTATDGFGNFVTFNYTTVSQYSGYINTNGLGLGYPYSLFQGPLSIVSSNVQSDGIGGNYTVSRYYQGAMVHRQGRGFVGFWSTNITDSRNGTWLYNYFEQVFPKTGQVYQLDQVQPNNATLISRSQATWTSFSLGSGAELRYLPYVSSSTANKYEVGGAYNGVLVSTTVTSSVAPDSVSGEVYDSTTTTTESATGNGISQGQSWTGRTYSPSLLNDTTNWCLGRPNSTQIINSHTMTGGTAQTRITATSWDAVNCRPTQNVVEPSTVLAVTTGIQYDAFGNPTIQTVTGYAMTARTTTTGWSSDGRFPISVTNALNQTATASFYQDTGLPYQATDPNDLTTTLYYDNFGRKTQETRPDGTYSVNYYNLCDGANSYCWTGFATVRVRTDRYDYSTTGTLLNAALVYTDMQDRVRWQYDRLNRSGNWEGTYRYIDSLGRSTSETLRFAGAISTGSRDYLYDLLGRVTRIRTFNYPGSLMNQVTTTYNGLTTLVTDHYNKNKTTIANAIGQTRQSLDHNGYYQLFQFDAFGNPTQVTDGDGKTLQSAVFNIRGMRTQSTDADMGTWNYYYNALGELTSQIDAKSQSIAFSYDLLGRPLTKTEPSPSGGTVTSNWIYGTSAASKNIGRLYEANINGGGTTYYREVSYYDSLARPNQSAYWDGSVWHYVDTTYNSTTGLMDSVTYPTSTSGYRHQVIYEYQYGFQSKVRDSANTVAYWTFNAEDPNGAITQETLGNGLKTTRSIEGSTGALNSIQTGPGGGSSVQNLNYSWDNMGNLLTRGDANQGVSESFGYDSLYRLTSAQVSGQPAQTVSYANNGNILTKSDVGSYTYSPTKIHAVTAAGGNSYAYDANGNVTTRTGSSVTWYANNKPKSIAGSGQTSTFEYGPSGQYWKQVASYSNGTETSTYIGGVLEMVASTATGITSYRHHIHANGRTVAIYNRGSNGANNTVYPLVDHLGSVEAITDQNGAIIVKESFDPWGKRRGSNWVGLPSSGDLTNIANSTRRGYTGHTMLDNVGLVHMNGRVYDPVIGRFLSADPFIQFADDTQSWNRYTYVLNNPLSYTDPSGYFSFKKLFRAIINIVKQIVIQAVRSWLNTVVPGLGDVLYKAYNLVSAIKSKNPLAIVGAIVGLKNAGKAPPGLGGFSLGRGSSCLVACGGGGGIGSILQKCIVGCNGGGGLTVGGMILHANDGASESDGGIQEVVVSASRRRVSISFSTLGEAVRDFFNLAASLSRDDPANMIREWSTSFYYRNGSFTYSTPTHGQTGETDVRVAKDAVAWAHTHPPDSSLNPLASGNDESNKYLSSYDRRTTVPAVNFVVGQPIPAYLGASDGAIRVFGPDRYTGPGITVAGPGTLQWRRTR